MNSQRLKTPAPTPTKSRPTRYWSMVYEDQCHKLSPKVRYRQSYTSEDMSFIVKNVFT